MGGISKLWTDAMADANKALGKDGDLPKPRLDIVKACEGLEDVNDDFDKMEDAVEKVIDDMNSASTKVQAATKAYRNQIEKDMFGLDPSDAKNKKTIAAVSKILTSALDSIDGYAMSCDSLGDDLDKAIANVKRPKMP
jgi:hypothetical protein